MNDFVKGQKDCKLGIYNMFYKHNRKDGGLEYDRGWEEQNKSYKNIKKNVDVPVEGTFEFEGKEYIVKKYSIEHACISKGHCEFCAFQKRGLETCNQLCCMHEERRDKTEVYFMQNI